MKNLVCAVSMGFLVMTSHAALGEEPVFRCEVLTVQGSVTASDAEGNTRELKAGDLIEAGETVSTGEASYADLAYDKEWKNVTRLEPKTRAKIASAVPGKLDLKSGGIYSKLKQIPKDSTFEVRTPTAVATVRGTEYRTLHVDGQTDIVNVSSSKVYVYGVTPAGAKDEKNLLVLEKDNKTNVASPGKRPSEPVAVTSEEKDVIEVLSKGIDEGAKEAVKEGRQSQLFSVTEIEKTTIKKEKTVETVSEEDKDLSRVTDTRRRAFGGNKALAPEAEPEEAKTDNESR